MGLTPMVICGEACDYQPRGESSPPLAMALLVTSKVMSFVPAIACLLHETRKAPPKGCLTCIDTGARYRD